MQRNGFGLGLLVSAFSFLLSFPYRWLCVVGRSLSRLRFRSVFGLRARHNFCLSATSIGGFFYFYERHVADKRGREAVQKIISNYRAEPARQCACFGPASAIKSPETPTSPSPVSREWQRAEALPFKSTLVCAFGGWTSISIVGVSNFRLVEITNYLNEWFFFNVRPLITRPKRF